MSWGARTDLHLRIKIAPERLPALLEFLRDAVPFYESPSGIKVRLLQSAADPTQLIELVEYKDDAAYQADQKRVESDPKMKMHLACWRELLAAPPQVETYRDITSQIPLPRDAKPMPTLTTDRLVIRPYRDEDAEDLARLIGDREVSDTMLLVPHPYTLADARSWLGTQRAEFASGRGLKLAITHKADGQQVGGVGLMIEPEYERAELGYWIGKAFWGRGYATEAAIAVVDHGFTVLGLNRIFALHFARNPQSGRIMQKIGMKPEGVRRQSIRRRGRCEDSVGYAILREEWAAR